MPSAEPADDSRSWPRQCARVSMIAPFAALLISALGYQLMRRQSAGVAEQVYVLVSSLSALLAAAGIAAAAAALWGAWRRGTRDTLIIAALGLFVGGCYVALCIRAVLLVWSARGS